MAGRKGNRSGSPAEPPGPGPLGRLADLVLGALAAAPPSGVLLAGFLFVFALSLRAMKEDSATFDEGVYLASGYSYLQTGDFRMNSEQPALMKLFAALPLLVLGPHLPLESEAWDRGDEWDFGFQFLYHSGNKPESILLAGRLSSLFWGMLLAGAVFAVARERFGPLGGAAAFLLALSCPTLLGHSRVATMDVMLAALCFLTVVSAQRWADRPTPWRAISSGVLLGGTLLAKFTGLLLVPVLPVVGVLFWKARSQGGPDAGSSAPEGKCSGRWTLGLLAVTAIGLVWAAYQFQVSPSPGLTPRYGEADGAPRSPVLVAVKILDLFHLLPGTYLFGLAEQVQHEGAGHHAYALGLRSQSGWWWYFPLAFVLKTPLTSIALSAWGAGAAFRRMRGAGRSESAWLLVPAALAAVSLGVRLNLGIRYLLPVFPFLWMLAGGIPGLGGDSPATSRSRRIVLALLLVGLVDIVASTPYQLAYFNWTARLLGKPHELLVDSNLDWGQDLGRLKAYLDRHGIADVKLSYFGAASPSQLGLRHRQLPGFNLYATRGDPWPTGEPLLPGDLVAISATNLAGAYLEDPEYYQRLVGKLRPEAVIGSSIYLYRIPSDH